MPVSPNPPTPHPVDHPPSVPYEQVPQDALRYGDVVSWLGIPCVVVYKENSRTNNKGLLALTDFRSEWRLYGEYLYYRIGTIETTSTI